MAEYELTPQIQDALVSILRRAAQRGRELREQRAKAGSESTTSVSDRDGVATLQPALVKPS
ncbi:MAG: hypothetical protein GY832_31110 [Chloroflexi bacterium]|nr:hypothetical protein [Chloroflexota bacterium]